MGLDLLTIWTCEIEAELAKDKEMRNFFDNTHDMGPISLRDAYHGGTILTQKE
jgi:hypothetical protein